MSTEEYPVTPPGAKRIDDLEAEMGRLADARKQPTIDAGVLLAAIREGVTVVKPRETLIVRAQAEWSPNQIRELQITVNAWIKEQDLGVKVLILPGEEFAVATKGAG